MYPNMWYLCPEPVPSPLAAAVYCEYIILSNHLFISHQLDYGIGKREFSQKEHQVAE